MTYPINKGINKPIEFKGLKAQYIVYLGVGLLALLVLYAILYIACVNTLVCLGIIGLAGTALFVYVFRLSRVYGEHGLMKQQAKRHLPKVVKSNGRTLFFTR